MCSLNFVNRELAVLFHRDDVPFDGFIVICIDDVLMIPSNLMKLTSDAGVVPANKEVQALRRLAFHQEVVASHSPLRGEHVTPPQTARQRDKKDEDADDSDPSQNLHARSYTSGELL